MPDVYFARYNAATGRILNVGVMHEDHVLAEQSSGVAIVEVDSSVGFLTHKIDVQTKQAIVLSTPIPGVTAQPVVDVMIQLELQRTDKYFTSDATDNITPQDQQSWRTYRKTLRAAAKLATDQTKIAAIGPDPKGVDRFSSLR